MVGPQTGPILISAAVALSAYYASYGILTDLPGSGSTGETPAWFEAPTSSESTPAGDAVIIVIVVAERAPRG